MARSRRQRKSAGKRDEVQWIIVFYEEGDGSVPARAFLDACPRPVRQQLLATLVAVRDAPPHSFPASALWHVMRDDMRGVHEARDKHGKQLYRLFCILDREGLDAPAIVLLSGGVKPIGAPMDARVYGTVQRQRDEYRASDPRRVQR